MTWRKTWFSYFIWGVSSVLLCLAMGWYILDVLQEYQLSLLWIALPVILVLLCYLMIKGCKKKVVPLQISGNYWVTMEGLLFVVLFAGGFLARLYTVTDISGTDMFQMCSISLQSSQIPNYAGDLMELFVAFYKNVFYYVGNSWIVAVAVQLNMQLISFVVLYFVVRKFAGVIAALISYSFLLFSPMCISASVALNPTVMYFAIFVLALYFVTESVSRIVAKQKVQWYQFISALFIGLFTGAAVYLDLIGIVAVIFGLTLLGGSDGKDKDAKVKYKLVYFILYVLGVLFGVFCMLFVASGFEINNLKDTFLAWESLFVPAYGQPLYLPFGITFGLREWIYAGLLFFVCLLGVVGFWESKDKNPQFGPAVSVLLILALRYNCHAAQLVDRRILIIGMLAVLAGTGICALLYKEDEVVEEVDMEAEEYEEAPEETAETTEVVETIEAPEIAEVVETIETPASSEIQFIPNPLPLPKKHVKKTMHYGIEVEEEKMDFDIEISEDDDFDI